MNQLMSIKRIVRAQLNLVAYLYGKFMKTPMMKKRNAGKDNRMLDIGPGAARLAEFETLNVVAGRNVDYVADASVEIPFPDETFTLVHASHVLEHLPWYSVQQTLAEWARVLKKGGTLEIWVPDGYKLAKFLVDIEDGIDRPEWHDAWRPRNMPEDPYRWLNGRLLYGVRNDYPSWHTAVITPKFLQKVMHECGLVEVEIMDETEVRAVAHGWINLGVRGRKL